MIDFLQFIAILASIVTPLVFSFWLGHRIAMGKVIKMVAEAKRAVRTIDGVHPYTTEEEKKLRRLSVRTLEL